MTLLALDHVAIPVRDAERSRIFYEGVLGLPLVDAMSGDDWEGRPWLLMFFALGDGRQLALTSFRDAAHEAERGLPSDARHYAFGAGDLAPWRARLAAAGVVFRQEDHGVQQSLFVADPDGTVVEITCPPTPERAAAPHDARSRARVERVLAEWTKGASTAR